MGGIFGGKKTKTTEKSDSTQKQTNWLAENPQYKALVDQTIAESADYNIPDYQLAQQDQGYANALEALSKGVDTSAYKNASDYFMNQGRTTTDQAQQTLNQYQGVLQQIGGMGASDYSRLVQNEMNGSLMQEQTAALQSDLADQTGSAIRTLNEQAGASGNMGNSRAGVAQGVIQGQAAKALASGVATIHANEENAATNRVAMYLNNKLSAATTGAGIAQNQLSQGYNLQSMGLNALNQYNAASMQNIQNSLMAGQQRQTYQQTLLDVQRQNQLQRMSPALNRLMYVNQGLGPIAGYSTSGESHGTTTTVQSQSGGTGQALLGMAGMAAGAYFSGGLGLTAMQGAQLGGTFGAMAGAG